MARRGGAPLALAVGVIAMATPAAAEPSTRWIGVSIFAGSAASQPATIEVTQDGAPDLEFRARFETRAFEQPLYYVARLELGSDRGPWELQLVHHKLHLRDPPPEISHFEVSHGYNLLTVGHAWTRESLAWRVGAGVVVPHAESTVRGRPLDAGYALGGPVASAGGGFRLPLAGRTAALVETMITAAWATMDVAGGHAWVPNLALHLMIGVGWSLPIRDRESGS